MMEVEICCGDIKSVAAAAKGGAKRIELCSALEEGGITPSLAMIREAVKTGIPAINVLIRPRQGDFLYSEEEIRVMKEDIESAIDNGAHGIVVGVLTPDGEVDIKSMKKLIDAIHDGALRNNRKIGITFHRAFDLVADPFKSLEDIIALECTTILTSGLASNAVKGIPVLKQLVEKSAGRIAVMAGSGINPGNAAEIIKNTGVNAIHASARKKEESKMKFRREEVMMGRPGEDEYSMSATSPEIVESLIKSVEE